jgi:hypothetical protein
VWQEGGDIVLFPLPMCVSVVLPLHEHLHIPGSVSSLVLIVRPRFVVQPDEILRMRDEIQLLGVFDRRDKIICLNWRTLETVPSLPRI